MFAASLNSSDPLLSTLVYQGIHPVCLLRCLWTNSTLNNCFLTEIISQNKVLSLNYTITWSSCFSFLNAAIVDMSSLKCLSLVLLSTVCLIGRKYLRWEQIDREESKYLVYSSFLPFMYILKTVDPKSHPHDFKSWRVGTGRRKVTKELRVIHLNNSWVVVMEW